jgi:lipoyl(octanoyl) transferase
VAELSWEWLGRAAYRDVYARQREEREAVWAGGPGRVLLCEHAPVITLGRSATEANILDARGIAIERIERGGEVTYHGPGQLMIYAIVRIKSVIEFLERVASAIIETSAAFGVAGATWRRDPAGVWIAERKLAACGIHVARGVVMHGFAFNVATPRERWRTIRPCGLDVPQVSLSDARRESHHEPASIDLIARDIGPRVVRAVS